MKIGSSEIANFAEPYIIAELGANHNGDMALAHTLVREAKKAGCNCVKFQSWTKESIFSKKVYEENKFLEDDYRNRNDYTLESIVDAYSVSEKELRDLKALCDSEDIEFGCTPFSRREVDFLTEELNIAFVKIASMDVNNYDFLKYVASKKKPVVLSTGLSTLAEIDQAVRAIESTGNLDIILLHCIAVYPPRDETINLRNIEMLRAVYPEYPVGFSDHSLGTAVSLASVALGACMIEKHFTLDKNMPGWDHKVSMTPDEMAELVAGSKKIVKALGTTRRVLSSEDYHKIPAFRRSVVAARRIAKGQTIEAADLDVKRPGTGLEPQYVHLIIGRVAKRDIDFDDMLTLDDF
ncbi:MAG: N-acetylneuraminate synthase family protein [Methylovirgula sp.]